PPGGLGITELGLVTFLTAGAGHKASVQVTAAVLLYRAVTYLPSIPLGALACLTWRLAPALISNSSRHAHPASPHRHDAACQPQRLPPPDEPASHHMPGQHRPALAAGAVP